MMAQGILEDGSEIAARTISLRWRRNLDEPGVFGGLRLVFIDLCNTARDPQLIAPSPQCHRQEESIVEEISEARRSRPLHQPDNVVRPVPHRFQTVRHAEKYSA